MKRLTLLLALLSIATITHAQKAVVFSTKYLPSHTYRITTIEKVAGEMNGETKSNSESTLEPERMKMGMALNTVVDASISTKKLLEGYPVNILIHDMMTNVVSDGKELKSVSKENPTDGIPIEGKIDNKGLLQADTSKYSDEVKISFRSLNSALGQISFPEKALKIGDTFDSDQDFPLEVANFDFTNLKITLTYKLMAIKDNLAYFDISMVKDFNFNQKIQDADVAVQVKANGSGKVVFDMGKSFLKSFVENFDIAFNAKSSKTNINVKSNQSRDSQYIVTANP